MSIREIKEILKDGDAEDYSVLLLVPFIMVILIVGAVVFQIKGGS
jgi:hypothetical protein